MCGARGRLVLLTGAIALVLGAGALWAQDSPVRPRLAAEADTNDWQAYFDYGVEQLPRVPGRADAAFYWAGRLDPWRSEPFYGRWVTYWMRHDGDWADYLAENPRILRKPEVRRADSLLLAALVRNPLTSRRLEALVYHSVPGEWGHDLATEGYLAYAAGRYGDAVKVWGRLVLQDSVRNVWWRYNRALAFAAMQQFDSARVEITRLTAQVDTASTKIVLVYQSRELLHYAIGLLEIVHGDHAAARSALGYALVENLAFAPAHAALGELAAMDNDHAAAAQELAQAVELDSANVWYRFRYGAELVRAGRSLEALVELRRAIELEPFYAEPYFVLGRALEGVPDTSGAVGAFLEYLRRSPRRMEDQRTTARQRILALGGRIPS